MTQRHRPPGRRALLALAFLLLGACEGRSLLGPGDAGLNDLGGADIAASDAADAPVADVPATDVEVDGGVVPACPAGQVLCGDACADVGTDPAHCGACGVACGASDACNLGRCAPTCAAGLTRCGRSCVDPRTDLAHCGACGTACPRGSVCSGGACVCPVGSVRCVDRCVDLRTSAANCRAHCGACGTACAGGAGVLRGRASPRAPMGLTDVRRLVPRHPERPRPLRGLRQRLCRRARCARTGVRELSCARAHQLRRACASTRRATAPTAARAAPPARRDRCAPCGACVTSCPGGQVSCGGLCRDLDTDRAHCGALRGACAAGAGVLERACVTCRAAWAHRLRGLVPDTQSDRAHCGMCGRVCAPGRCASGACV
jgi:hypothetical protein